MSPVCQLITPTYKLPTVFGRQGPEVRTEARSPTDSRVRPAGPSAKAASPSSHPDQYSSEFSIIAALPSANNIAELPVPEHCRSSMIANYQAWESDSCMMTLIVRPLLGAASDGRRRVENFGSTPIYGSIGLSHDCCQRRRITVILDPGSSERQIFVISLNSKR